MKLILLLCLIHPFVSGTINEPRIIGGQNAEPGQFKFVASLRIDSSNFHACGATIINEKTLLTAAHCNVLPISSLVAVVGATQINDTSASRYKIAEIRNHPDFDSSYLTSDIALVFLQDALVLGDNVQPVKMPDGPAVEGDRATVMGWGLTTFPGEVGSNDLQWLQTNVINYKYCVRNASDRQPGKICTFESKGKGICQGDSGGPLVSSKMDLIGVISDSYGCAEGDADYFTDVYFFKDWIVENLNM